MGASTSAPKLEDHASPLHSSAPEASFFKDEVERDSYPPPAPYHKVGTAPMLRNPPEQTSSFVHPSPSQTPGLCGLGFVQTAGDWPRAAHATKNAGIEEDVLVRGGCIAAMWWVFGWHLQHQETKMQCKGTQDIRDQSSREDVSSGARGIQQQHHPDASHNLVMALKIV